MKRNHKAIRPLLLSSPEPIIRAVLYGTASVVALLTLLLFISYAIIGNYYVLPRLGAALVVLAYVGIACFLFAKDHFALTAWLIVVFYTGFGMAILALWGLNAPVGVLIVGFTIMLAGIMLGARYILGVTIMMSGLILLIQAATNAGWLKPDTSTLDEVSTYLDALSYCVIFVLFAIIAWLAGRRSEQLLHKSQGAESALQREKDLLSVRLEQKTREVREAQLEEMRQLYRFAELGQLGAVLLHDLANNLTALTLDIDDIGTQMQRNESITRAKESIAYLESMVNGVRRQIHASDKPVVFDAPKIVLETIAALGTKARRAGVLVEYVMETKTFPIKGDPVRFAHVLTILLSNAIESYVTSRRKAPSVSVRASVIGKNLEISVTDQGRGLTILERERLFKPFVSSKADGMGIGLFMAHEMVERHFGGSLTLDPSAGQTTFVLRVPHARNRARHQG